MKIKRKPHLSWSQISLWEQDPNKYHQKYVEGIELPETPAMKFGKYVADELNKKESNDPVIEQIRMFTPKCEQRERKYKAKFDGIQLFGIFDGINKTEEEIIEIKTGKNWTQAMVNKHGQLDMYALLYYLKYNKIPKSVKLVWIETYTTEDGEVKITGKFTTFSRKIQLRDIIKFGNRIKKVDKEIQEMYDMLNE